MNQQRDLTGRLRAVPFDRAVAEASWKWFQDRTLREETGAAILTRVEQERWYANLSNRSDYWIWGIALDGDPLGAFGIKHVAANSGESWLYVAVRKYQGVGIGTWAIRETECKARELNLTSLSARVLSTNERSLRLHERHGYVFARRDDEWTVLVRRLYSGAEGARSGRCRDPEGGVG